MDSLGSRIKNARQAQGMALRELARQAGVAPAFVTDIEAGRRMPGHAVLGRIADALSIPLAEFEALDPRITPEVRQWMEDEPRVGALLRALAGHRGRDALLSRMERLIQEDKTSTEGEAAMWTIEFPHETIGGANDLCRQAGSGLVANQGGRLGFEATGSREAVNALAELLNQRSVGFFLAET